MRLVCKHLISGSRAMFVKSCGESVTKSSALALLVLTASAGLMFRSQDAAKAQDPAGPQPATTEVAAAEVAATGVAATEPAAEVDPPTTQPAEAPAPQANEAMIRTWLDQLADSDPQVREQAFSSLMHIKRPNLPALRKAAQESLPLAPSQATVLRQIVRQVYMAGDIYEVGLPSGFLGIQMSEFPLSFPDPDSPDAKTPPGVVIDFRMVGFCAAASLRDGDAILEIAERPQAVLRSSYDLKSVVGDLEPGHTYHFLVLRDGRIRNVPIVLDARPADPELLVHGSNENDERQKKADDYWEKNFAPLLKTVS